MNETFSEYHFWTFFN